MSIRPFSYRARPGARIPASPAPSSVVPCARRGWNQPKSLDPSGGPADTGTVQSSGWEPRRLGSVVRVFESSTKAAEVETDDGPAFLKSFGNPQGPEALTSEWLGTLAAEWLGLDVAPMAALNVEMGWAAMGVPEGPAFVSKKVDGYTWDGLPESLAKVADTRPCTLLVVLDTWILNRDRYSVWPGETISNVRNVMFRHEKGQHKPSVMALDQSEAFLRRNARLGPKTFNIDRQRYPQIFGCFPEFLGHWDGATLTQALDTLGSFKRGMLRARASEVPREWTAPDAVEQALEFLELRAHHLAEHMPKMLSSGRWAPEGPK